MKFARDILLLDMETTGINPEKDFVLQLSAVLLDRDNLLEVNNFNSYIRHPFSQTTNDKIVQTLGITKEAWFKAPNLKEAITSFNSRFSYNLTIASQNIINVNFLQAAYTKTGLAYEFDYHIFELWTFEYLFLCRQNIKKIPTASTVASFFNLKKEKEHDAFVNCRYLADIFRKLVKAYENS
jgi:DNA polymerase III alpha subunit (gram-positive type)